MTAEDLPIELKKLSLKPGDFLVCRIKETLSPETTNKCYEIIKQELQRIALLGKVGYVVMATGGEISVSEEEMNQFGWYRKEQTEQRGYKYL